MCNQNQEECEPVLVLGRLFPDVQKQTLDVGRLEVAHLISRSQGTHKTHDFVAMLFVVDADKEVVHRVSDWVEHALLGIKCELA